MRTEIGQLALNLPAGLEGRAGRIGRLVGEALARRALPAGRIDKLAVGPLSVDVRHSDRAIADRIAESIHAAIGRGVTEA